MSDTSLKTRRQIKEISKSDQKANRLPNVPQICISIPDTPQQSPLKGPSINVQFNLSNPLKQINPPALSAQQDYPTNKYPNKRKKQDDTPPTVKQPHEYKQLPLQRHVSSGLAGADFSINLPILRRAQTILNSVPNEFTLQKVQVQPAEKPIVFQTQKVNSQTKTNKMQLSPGNYEATSRWNDMVQDDQIDQFQRTNLPRISSQDSIESKILPGLANLGNTCFANSVLQCLAHTPALREYCRLGRHSEGCTIKSHFENQQQLPQLIQNIDTKYTGLKLLQTPLVQQVIENPHFCSFCVLEAHIKGICEKREQGFKQVSPLSVIMLISKIGGKGNCFKIGEQCDAEEFLLVLIENLYQASFGYLKKVPQSYERQTFIPKLFYFKMEQQIFCQKCQEASKSLADFVSLGLDLVRINKQDQQTSRTKSQQKISETLSFQDSLNSFFGIEKLELSGRCKCGSVNNYGKRYKLRTLPRVLIVALKRFDHNGAKYSHNVNVPHEFVFNQNFLNQELQRKEKTGYVEQTHEFSLLSEPQQQQGKFKNHKYELYGMIVHDGYSTRRGHYYSLIKIQNNTKWAKFDDEKVNLVEPNQIQSYSQKAYLLFYQKVWVYKPDPIRQSARKTQEIPVPLLNKCKTVIDPLMLQDLKRFDQGLDESLNINNGGQTTASPPDEKSTKLVRLKHNNNNINSSKEGAQYKPSSSSRLRSARNTQAK